MKADDPITHQQMMEYAKRGRQAVAADYFVAIAKGHDEDRDATGHLMVYAARDENESERDKTAELIDCITIALTNVLDHYTTLEVVIRNKKTGESINPGGKHFGRRAMETKP